MPKGIYVRTKKHRDILSRKKFGKDNPFFGKKHTKETRDKISEKGKGRTAWNKGIKNCYTEETLERMRLSARGRVVDKIRENGHWNWKGGVSHRTKKLYEWRKEIFERDNYTCQKCGTKMSIIAHHIKSYYQYPKLRYEINNGITLCRSCHCKEHPELINNLK